MSSVRCFMIEPSGLARMSLRRYHSSADMNDACPATGRYHNAQVYLRDVAEMLAFDPEYDCEVFIFDGPQRRDELSPEDQTRWPTHCACGYAFGEPTDPCDDCGGHGGDPYQIFHESIYRRTDTGETLSLHDTPAGAMWWARWMPKRFFNPQLGEFPLVVMLPGGHEWMPDSQANNCTIPDDHNQERHHCWVAHGTPPDVTVDKSGVTCQAGAGSIVVPGWHGFLQNGNLVA